MKKTLLARDKYTYKTNTEVIKSNNSIWSGTVCVQAFETTPQNNQAAYKRVSTVDVYSITSLIERFK